MRSRRFACALAALVLMVLCAPAGAFWIEHRQVETTPSAPFILYRYSFAFSGNGRYVAYGACPNDQPGIYRVDVDHPEDIRKIRSGEIQNAQSWLIDISDDGKTIAFREDRPPSMNCSWGLCVWRDDQTWGDRVRVTINSTSEPEHCDFEHLYEFALSGDGRYAVCDITYAAGTLERVIWRQMLPDGFDDELEVFELVSHEALDLYPSDCHPVVNDDGNVVSYRCNEFYNHMIPVKPFIAVRNISTGDLYRHGNQDEGCLPAGISDDGSRVAFETGPNLSVNDTFTGELEFSTTGSSPSRTRTGLSGDGRYLVFSRRQEDRSPLEIWVAHIDTGEEHRVTTCMEFPELQGYYISDDGRRIAFVNRDGEDLGIYVADLHWGPDHYLYQAEDALEVLPDEAFGKPERKAELLSKLAEIQAKAEAGDYRGARNKLEKDLGRHVRDWVTDAPARDELLRLLGPAKDELEVLLR